MNSRSLLATQFTAFLESQDVKYVIVGDCSRFPHEIRSDIDLVVDPKIMSEIPQIIISFCALYRARVVQYFQHEQSAYYYIVALMDKDLGIAFLHPDICSDYFREGKLMLKAEEMLEKRVIVTVNNNKSVYTFFVPDPPVAFIYYLLKKIEKGILNQSHGEYLSREWRKNPDGVLHQLKRFWQDHELKVVLDAAQTNNWSNVRSKLPKLRKVFRGSLQPSLRHWFGEVLRKVHRVRQPTGLFVVFLGTDGAGKSTIIKQIEKKLSPVFRQTRCYHLRPFFGSNYGHGIRVNDPHARPLRGRFYSTVKLGFWWLDYTFGYLWDVFPRLTKSTLILFDRYYYDLLIDQKRYRYGGPVWIAKLIGLLIPKPDLVILLDAPAEIVCARKQEVLPLEVNRQRLAYKALASRLTNSHIVNASLPVATVLYEVESIIIEALGRRARKRLCFPG